MNDNEAQAILERLLAGAKRAGADAADALIYHAVSSSVSWRLGKLEDVERAEGRDLGLRILFGKRQASVSTTEFSPDGLDELVERCAAMAKAAPEDPYCGLAPADRLAKPPFPDLDLGDFNEPDTTALKARAAACEEAALAIKGVVNSEGAGASYGEGSKWFATSTGFFGTSGGSRHSVSVSVVAKDAAGMERDYDYDSKTHYDDMRAPDAIGKRAGERAVERLSPRKLKSQSAPIIYSDRLSDSLIGSLAGAINGAAIARGVSFLKDKKGQAIFPKGMNVIDDPHMKRGSGSRPFDGEGVAAARLKIIDDGVLTDWLMNSAHARQLGLQSNGRATRGVGGAPGAGPTNFYLEAGAKTPAELMADAGKGLLVTDMFGPQVNPNTGDYSVGCSGFWFEGGAQAYPVSEITIAGNILEMYRSLIAANDLEFRGSINAPTLLVGAMTIAGD
ncbi:MAG: TldD/PmbA family protein [Amphiplicatus sp.]|nr:TldD/PmbA family protein [Amphiplicatus sp.]MCB9956857.1 TldD/PmbA family protein [Caulobacterales bacterium]HRX40116.1 TldD/PmbA family protein [Parvularculaceae bacterium]